MPTLAVWRGGNWNYHPLDDPAVLREHNRQWDAREGGGNGAIAACARRYRSYDRASRTYLGRDGRRHRCPR
jgi:hypothetical protein